MPVTQKNSYTLFIRLPAESCVDKMSRKKFKEKMTEREKALMVICKPVVCSVCREESALFAKGVGFHPYEWEMNCNLCHRYGIGLDSYVPEHSEILEMLQVLRKRYIAGSSTAELATVVENLADKFDHLLHYANCECGGRLSIAAKPKCIFCDIEIFDSYFHFVDQPCERKS